MLKQIKKLLCEPGMYLVYLEREDIFLMQTGTSVFARFDYCFCCGHPASSQLVSLPEDKSPCNCGFLARLAAQDGTFIEFNEKLNQYILIWERGEQPLNYCISCGGRLPESNASGLYYDVTNEEFERLVGKTRNLCDFAEMVAVLGKPDRILEGTPDKEGVTGFKLVKQWATYEEISEFCNLTVTEYTDGSVNVSVSGKMREDLLSDCSVSEMDSLIAELKREESLEKILLIPGEPDRRYVFDRGLEVRQRIEYRGLSTGFNLIVFVTTDNRIEFTHYRKLR